MIKALQNLKAASAGLRALSHQQRNAVLIAIAGEILVCKEDILRANELDLKAAGDLSEAMRNRLKLSGDGVEELAKSIEQIAQMSEVVGITHKGWQAKSGINISKIAVPIGTIAVIYEARPAVTAEVAALCIKSANTCALKGGKEAKNTNLAIFAAILAAFENLNLPRFIEYLDIDRDEVLSLIRADKYLDLIVPRGGESLVRFISQNASVPVLKHDKGLCHIYIDEFADIDKALKIAINAKCSRPAVCNAAETILIHEKRANEILPSLLEALRPYGVQIFACEKAFKMLSAGGVEQISVATDDNFATEYGDFKVNIKIVDSFNEAISHIERFGSQHSEAIISEDFDRCEAFLNRVDAACVYANASTRFSDGGEFGFGAEVGISTNKLHARGPVGLAELMTYKYIIRGHGEIR